MTENKGVWTPLSMPDSLRIEEAFLDPSLNQVVPTDGGRYDVHITERERRAVYWTETPSEVRRCSWFYKASLEARYIPYEERVADLLEGEFKAAFTTGQWHKTIPLDNGEEVIMYSVKVRTIPLDNGEEVIMYSVKVRVSYPSTSGSSSFFVPSSVAPPAPLVLPSVSSSETPLYAPPSNTTLSPPLFSPASSSTTDGSSYRLRGLKRPTLEQSLLSSHALEEQLLAESVDANVPSQLLTLYCMSPGSFCDLKFRPVVEVVDDFRSISLTLTASHFKSAADLGTLGRVEMLPISWHEALHSEESGIDKKLKAITLPSIPKLRYFTNDTLLDVLFYTSPVYCERIITAVAKEMNRLYAIFLARNPTYEGGVSVGGHSLGSLILFDLLSHQKPVGGLNSDDVKDSDTDDETLGKSPLLKGNSYISIPTATLGTSAPLIRYHQLSFQPRMFFAFGSPVGKCIRVPATLGTSAPLIRYHQHSFKGSVRMHSLASLMVRYLYGTYMFHSGYYERFYAVRYRVERVEYVVELGTELKDTLEYVGSALKQKLYDSMKSTWNKVSYLAMLNKTDDHAASVSQDVTQPRMFFAFGSPVGKCIRVPATLGTSAPLIRYHQLSFQPRMFFAFRSPVGKCIRVPATLGTSAPLIRYHQLSFQPRMFFAFGSPVGMFVNVRGIDVLGEEFEFPTCPKFYNIFHPFDPVAYRIEPLIVPAMEHVRPVQVPHHKGRKRMHLGKKTIRIFKGSISGALPPTNAYVKKM
ncbi:phospholipase DDHD2 [Diaphorina citri]|uniref:Phospholipase DDHD2 n=1 Tax=Diaphorina citri TaxID=121845 RepID=A0A3Q0IP18_DIACI|nr:phospholipase DDHD2 [Diaphorina citri]